MPGQIAFAILAFGVVVKKRGIAYNEIRFFGPTLNGPLMHLDAIRKWALSRVFSGLLGGFGLEFHRVDFRRWEALCQHQGKHA